MDPKLLRGTRIQFFVKCTSSSPPCACLPDHLSSQPAHSLQHTIRPMCRRRVYNIIYEKSQFRAMTNEQNTGSRQLLCVCLLRLNRITYFVGCFGLVGWLGQGDHFSIFTRILLPFYFIPISSCSDLLCLVRCGLDDGWVIPVVD